MNDHDEWWLRFCRWGPYALLALATVIAAFTVDELEMSPGEVYAVPPLLVTALALHLWAGWAGVWSGTVDPDTGVVTHNFACVAYYVVRTFLAFALTCLNPFYSIYAVIGYFDAGHLLPGRWCRVGLLVTAVTMALSQSGGAWGLFVALFFLHAALTMVFEHLGRKAEADRLAKAATILALEDANARLEKALSENAGLHEQLLVQAREAGVTAERTRLAAEIHDTIAQALTGIVTQLQAATDSPDPAATAAHIDRATSLARTGLSEARRSVRDLSPAALEHDDLPEALAKTVTEWARSTATRAEFTVTGAVAPLHDEIQATLLRIAQEALTNTAKHARASRVGVTLSYMGDEITLDVRDDGRGFDPGAESGLGFGLTGMRARAERLAGTVDTESEPGFGTAISARVPLVNHA
ncbi:sensor histidine kinase [Streptomyces sp. NPDC004111]|uniref:sensor histidine kinase n=1 Tax=Streptomyces sp. NPDC004111 TaxID=3364690 RepID=UPI003684EB1E